METLDQLIIFFCTTKVKLSGFTSLFEIGLAINLGYVAWKELRTRTQREFKEAAYKFITEDIQLEQNCKTVKELQATNDRNLLKLTKITKHGFGASIFFAIVSMFYLLVIALYPNLYACAWFTTLIALIIILTNPILYFHVESKSQKFQDLLKEESQKTIRILADGKESVEVGIRDVLLKQKAELLHHAKLRGKLMPARRQKPNPP